MFRGPRPAGGPAVGGRRGSQAVPAGNASLAPGHTLPVQATAAIFNAAKVKSPIPDPAEIDSGPGRRSWCLAAIGKMAADQDSCPGRVAGTGDRLRSWPAA